MPPSLTVIIPTLNSAKSLPACLQSLLSQSLPANQILIVDGGSTDATPTIAANHDLPILTASGGRGGQISSALAQATGDFILILHSDCTLATDTLARLHQRLFENPQINSGIIGVQFTPASLLTRGLEGGNRLRFFLFHLSFGDQGQFFRRSLLPAFGGFPDFPLMEDVELSLRLRPHRHQISLGHGITAASDRLHRDGWHRLYRIPLLVLRFCLARDRRRAAHLAYQTYYGHPPAQP